MELRRLSRYRIDWIVSFVAVARHNGFSSAGKALFLSQPRISSHIADLEAELGVRLFDRSVHPAVLTPEGRALQPHAEQILQQLSILADLTGGQVRGEVRLAAYPSAAAYLFPLVARILRRAHPAVRLVFREGPSVALSDALANRDVDLAIRPALPLVNDDRLASTVLWREPLVVVVRPDHPLASAETVRLSQIAGLELIMIGESQDAYSRQFEANLAFASAGIIPTIAAQTNQPQTLVSLVRHGLGDAGVTNSLAMTTANVEGVTLVPLADAHCDRVVALWHRVGHVASPAVEAVRRAITALPVPTWPWAPGV